VLALGCGLAGGLSGVGVIIGLSGSSPGGVGLGDGTTVAVGVGVTAKLSFAGFEPLVAMNAKPKIAMQNNSVRTSFEGILRPPCSEAS